jgi:hypothetical protein
MGSGYMELALARGEMTYILSPMNTSQQTSEVPFFLVLASDEVVIGGARYGIQFLPNRGWDAHRIVCLDDGRIVEDRLRLHEAKELLAHMSARENRREAAV